jgi:pimeloyl-[acyl-carrier protein] methyl ester esterase
MPSLPHRVLLLPGLDGSGRLSQRFARAWNAPLDLVAYRDDPTADLDAYAEQVEEIAAGPSVDLIAESFSGPVALRIIERARIQVRRLVLVASFAAVPVASPLALAHVLPRALLTSLPRPRWAVAWLLLGGVGDAALIDEAIDVVRALPPSVMASRLALLAGLRAQQLTGGPPILALHAMRDRLVPASATAVMQRSFPQVSVVPINGPHLLLQAEPAACADAIRSYLGDQALPGR